MNIESGCKVIGTKTILVKSGPHPAISWSLWFALLWGPDRDEMQMSGAVGSQWGPSWMTKVTWIISGWGGKQVLLNNNHLMAAGARMNLISQ